MTVITMSRNELTRLRVLIDVADGRLSVADATGLIGVGRRQIYRLLQAFRADGADGLISRKRGGPSNRALGSVFRETVLAIVRERYADFGPTLAAEKLSELCRRRHQPPDAPEVRRDRINLRLLPGDP
jgi:transposase